MNIEELSVGNHVYYAHEEGIYRVVELDSVTGIVTLLPEHIIVEQASDRDYVGTLVENIKEIPLTEFNINKSRLINNNMQLSDSYHTCIALNECLYASLHSLQNAHMAMFSRPLNVAGCFTESNDAPPKMDIIATLREMLDYFERGGRIL
jgi:hypothetical protein